MEQITQLQTELTALFITLENNIEANKTKTNKSALNRARKNLQEIKRTAQELRIAILDHKKSL